MNLRISFASTVTIHCCPVEDKIAMILKAFHYRPSRFLHLLNKPFVIKHVNEPTPNLM